MPSHPRHAASLLVLQRDPSPTILMARRSAGHRFMPGVLVFPGGAVDEADFTAPVASPLRPAVIARLARAADPALAQALGVAAARELLEEVGLSLGNPPHLDPLHYLCRAITPPDSPIRFDARFFVVDAAHVHGEPRASRELEAPRWYDIEGALREPIALPTRLVLGHLRRWLTRPGTLEPEPVAVLRNRRWCTEE